MTARPLAAQGALFLVVGLAATAIHITVALGSRRLFGAAPMAANFLGYACAVGVSYAGNARWTFRAAHRHAQLARFVAVSLAGLALNQGLTFLVVSVLRLPFAVALALTVAIVPLCTFLLARWWVFAAGRRG